MVPRKAQVKRPQNAEKLGSPSLEPMATKPLPGETTASLEERLREEYRAESERVSLHDYLDEGIAVRAGLLLLGHHQHCQEAEEKEKGKNI